MESMSIEEVSRPTPHGLDTAATNPGRARPYSAQVFPIRRIAHPKKRIFEHRKGQPQNAAPTAGAP
jgi:hypothetical protein